MKNAINGAEIIAITCASSLRDVSHCETNYSSTRTNEYNNLSHYDDYFGYGISNKYICLRFDIPCINIFPLQMRIINKGKEC